MLPGIAIFAVDGMARLRCLAVRECNACPVPSHLAGLMLHAADIVSLSGDLPGTNIMVIDMRVATCLLPQTPVFDTDRSCHSDCESV